MNTQTQLVIFIIILSMFGLISSDIYIPSLPFIAQTFHISGGKITLSISVYLIALAISQIIYGVIVNSYGYKRILTLGIIIYIIASIGCALSNHIYSFLFFRFFQGIGAASGLVIGRYLISSQFSKDQSVQIYAIVYPFVSLSPAIAPLIGGYLTSYIGWKSNFYFLVIFAIIALYMTFKTPIKESKSDLKSIIFFQFISILKNRNFWRYTGVVCLIYQAWFIYLTQSTFVFKIFYGLSSEITGLLYLPLSAGIILANITTKKLLRFLSIDQIIGLGLIFFCIGGILFLSNLFLPQPSLTKIIFSMFIVSIANGSSLSLAVASAIHSSNEHTAAASGLVGFFQISSSGLISYWISHCIGQSISILSLSIFTLSTLCIFLFFFNFQYIDILKKTKLLR